MFRRPSLRLPEAEAGRPCVLLATEGPPIPKAAVARAADLARSSGARVHVLAIARVHGVGFALQAPGLYPSKHEWRARRETVASAIEALEKRGLDADGHVLGTRKATKRIVSEAERLGCNAIVMAAEPSRGRFVGDFMWSQEPYRVQRRSKIPVHLVPL